MYYDGAGTFSYATDQKYIGSKSMKVNKTNDAGNMCVYRNYSNLEVGKTYTLSAYIRSTGSVYCYATVSQGTWHDGEKVTPGSEWKRIFTTFTATQTSANLYFITMGGPGTMWIDAAQLEEGSVPNRYNLLENCDFSQSSSSPTFWTENGANDGDDGLIELMDDYQPAFLSANAMRLYGDPESNKGFYQDLAVSGAKDDVYVAGGIGSGINMRNAINIGMFPDIPIEKFHYIGNSSLSGAYLMMISTQAEEKVNQIAQNMTYLELSNEPGYMDEFVASCFIPHTDADLFPSLTMK